MFAIVGAGGKVGYATSVALRKADVPVKAILRNGSQAMRLSEIGCEIALADLQDHIALASAIGEADTVQVIIPPSPHEDDTAEQMRKAIESIARALESVRPRRILAISDYGAHVDHDIGMPTMCRTFEERLSTLNGHKIFLRSAEHMQNWGRSIPLAAASGTLPSFLSPADKLVPMISAPDLGLIAADLLLRPIYKDGIDVIHAEGPRRFSPNDVATAVGDLLGRSVKVEVVPRTQWKDIFEQSMSPTLAELLIKANDAQNTGGLVDVEPGTTEVHYGSSGLVEALQYFVHG